MSPRDAFLDLLSSEKYATGTAFQTAGIFGLASASFCTVRNLERIASPGSSRRDLSDSRRDRYVDVGLCLVLPLVYTLFRKCLLLESQHRNIEISPLLEYIVAPNQLVICECRAFNGTEPHSDSSS